MIFFLFSCVVPGLIVSMIAIAMTIKLRYLIPISLLTIIPSTIVYVIWRFWLSTDPTTLSGSVFNDYLVVLATNWVAYIIATSTRRDVILKATRGYV